jgi:hypothetical protein
MKSGEVYEANVSPTDVCYFQYVGSDATQLGGHVIRVFKNHYPNSDSPNLEHIVSGEVDFHAHVMLKAGVKSGHWKLVGVAQLPADIIQILFRSSGDYGNPAVKVSSDWWIWTMNQPQIRVGKLQGDNIRAEIGCVMPAQWVVERMRSGNFPFFYPDY